MKLSVETGHGTYSVHHIPDFSQIAEVRDNGQHYQFDGHALVEVAVFGDGITFKLYHASTKPSRGHVDVIVKRCGESYSFHQYAHNKEFDLCDSSVIDHVWPTGAWDIIRIIEAVERFTQDFGHRAGFRDWIIRRICGVSLV